MKDCRLEIRLSNEEKDIITRFSLIYGMSVSEFVLSVLIPYCVNKSSK